ncbi:MAG: serine/threonine-protein kinase, partial [Planctomycetota bacterium]|nr:serine/threonine-protein kinase [Planctomycetota bacterium]
MVFVEDLNSRNGTRVNGEPASVRVLDENGRIEIGASVIELSWVATESAVPLGAVASAAAPTLLDDLGKTTTLRRADEPAGSTVLGAQQLQELRAAQGRLGQTIGDFILLEVVGVGGMGFVYRAKNTKLRTEVALKLIARASAKTPRLLDRFLQECRTDPQVPGAARLLGTGLGERDAYVAMEFVHGRNLQSLVDAGRRFTAADIVAIAV